MMLDPMRNDAAPSIRLHKAKRIKRTRMPHFCNICGGDIPVGGPALKVTLMTSDDHAPGVQYQHPNISDCVQRVAAPVEGDEGRLLGVDVGHLLLLLPSVISNT